MEAAPSKRSYARPAAMRALLQGYTRTQFAERHRIGSASGQSLPCLGPFLREWEWKTTFEYSGHRDLPLKKNHIFLLYRYQPGKLLD